MVAPDAPEAAAALNAAVSVTTLVLAFIAEMVYCADPTVIFPPASILAILATVIVVAPDAAAAVRVVGANTEESLMPQA